MLTDRIVGAFTFRSGVYKEVEMDTSFTSTAWMLVAVVAFLNAIGSATGAADSIGGWIIGVIGGTVASVIGFALGCLVISWIGRSVFNADVTFEELVRTLGLAYVWNVVGVIGVLGIIPVLGCLTLPVVFLAFILGFIAWLVAAKEALDLEWGQTILTVIIGWVVFFVVSAIFALFGIGVGVLGALL